MLVAPPHFLIVSFDGLRPDLISPDLTPNLCRLQAKGVTLARHRTVYPSETRTAFPSLVTGATVDRHGMVGNEYFDRISSPPRSVDTADARLLRELDRPPRRPLFGTPTLGEVLAAHGGSLAVLATNTPGTTCLFNHRAEDLGHVRLSGHFRDASTPAAILREAEECFGPLPPLPRQGEPDLDAQTWITSAFLDLVWPRLRPDVTVLSYGEPDSCSHANGVGAAKTVAAIAHCDQEFSRVMDWWEAEGRAMGVHIVAVSDHGHVTGHTRVSVHACIRQAGFSPGAAVGPDVDVVVVPGQVGALYLPSVTPSRVTRLTEALMAQPWCGAVFTRPKNDLEGVAPGSLGSHLVFARHARSPDVAFSFRADDRMDPYGLVGGAFYDGGQAPGTGVHGGLHPKELAAVGIVAGAAFLAHGSVSTRPSGICDVMPTVLHVLGIDGPRTMTGRVLTETLIAPSPERPPALPEVFEARLGGYWQRLRRVRVGEHHYIEGAEVDGQL